MVVGAVAARAVEPVVGTKANARRARTSSGSGGSRCLRG